MVRLSGHGVLALIVHNVRIIGTILALDLVREWRMGSVAVARWRRVHVGIGYTVKPVLLNLFQVFLLLGLRRYHMRGQSHFDGLPGHLLEGFYAG